MRLEEVREFLKRLDQENIIFDPHFYKRSRNRPINEGMIRRFLSASERIVKVEIGKGANRFKLWCKMSRRYFLVLIIESDFSKDLKVISAWNTDKKWQDKLKQ